eukprot:39495-Pyramimonas_sp.AAC.1
MEPLSQISEWFGNVAGRGRLDALAVATPFALIRLCPAGGRYGKLSSRPPCACAPSLPRRWQQLG